MFDLDVEIDGIDSVVSYLGRIAKVIADPIPPLIAAREVIADTTAERFKSANGGEWPDILPTSRKGRRGNRSAPPLTDTGALMAAVTATREGVKDSLYHLDRFGGLVMGTDRVDAARHQFGFDGVDSRGRQVHEPARPFLYLDETTEAEITATFEEYYAAVIEGVR
jgi:phage gpG-like protein